ncbi:hypothetical protein [Peptacetobacter sp.]|uniref:hypothetical protein n=1 Tax=Peptacetobacter sp. TaxID=2991975 RepID=UPI003AB6CF4A
MTKIQREKQLQDKCIKYLKDNRIYCLNIFGSGFAGKGSPDIIACIGGKFVAFELKVGSNKMQDDQKIHKIRIQRSGGKHYTPYTIDEFIKIVEDLRNE